MANYVLELILMILVSHRVIENGKSHKTQQIEKTLSDAINIQVVSNIYAYTSRTHTLAYTHIIPYPKKTLHC